MSLNPFNSINNQTFDVYETKFDFYFNNEKFSSPICLSGTMPRDYQIVLGTRGFLDRYSVTFDYKNQEIVIV